MNKRDKRKRGEGHPLRGTRRVIRNCNSKIATVRFSLLVEKFEEAVTTLKIEDAVTHAVIEEECSKYTQEFNKRAATGSGEESSDDSVDSNLCGEYYVRTKQDLEGRMRITRNQGEGIHYMLDNQQNHVEGNKVWSPLGKSLPNDKKTWMTNPIMRGTSFTQGKHNSSGLSGSQGLLDHLKMNQEFCLYHRALLLWYYVLGEEGVMVWNGTCNGYCHEKEEVQDRINKSKARNAPAHDSGYLLLHFQSTVAGEEESISRWHQGHKVNKNLDWNVVE